MKIERVKIFISWSGKNSREIAKKLKEVFEKLIFPGKNLICFVSDIDIASGEDWWKKIKSELRGSKLGIICITKENIKAPWIYYEAGALIGNNVKTIPLLFNCNQEAIQNTPLSGKQCVVFHEKSKFKKMILEINDQFDSLKIPVDSIEALSDNAIDKMRKDLSTTFEKLKREGFFDSTYIYPKDISTINRKTVFISAPMNAIGSNDEYSIQRENLIEVVNALKKIGFEKIICPAKDIKNKECFDGKRKAIKNNFRNLKQVDSFVMIYNTLCPSSSLVELGYAIALCKKIVVFYREGLPYLIENAGEAIQHIQTIHFKEYSDIVKEIRSNEMALFVGSGHE